MKVAMLYLVPTRDTSISCETRYHELYEEIAWGNDQGFESVWVTEHHFSNYGYTPSPLIMLMKAAEVAPALRLGTAIIVLPLWDPIRLAEDVSTLDVLSGGRLELGLGRGYQVHEFEGYGRSLANNRPVFEEAVDLLLTAWKRDDFTYEGEHFRVPTPVTILPKPLQSPHPPIWMATTSPESIRYAARHGFHFMTGTFMTLPELKAHREFVSLCLAAEGRRQEDYEYEVSRFIFCSESQAEIDAAVEESRWQIRVARQLSGGSIPVKGINDAPPYPGEMDAATWRHRLVFGNPDQMLRQFEALADAGISYFGGEFQFGGLSHEQTMKSMRLFVKEVLPVVDRMVPNRQISPPEALAVPASPATHDPFAVKWGQPQAR
ncbi:MAG: LLM class flavin-dependent oxidoreductase [Chloroflexi bacterium]|nr:LLM class flavin-dependent oxidoreductase [Chloroflexota bacterium]